MAIWAKLPEGNFLAKMRHGNSAEMPYGLKGVVP
jgi:hypothetical protein